MARAPFVSFRLHCENDPRVQQWGLKRGYGTDRTLAAFHRLWDAVRLYATDGDVTRWTDQWLAAQLRVPRPSGIIADLVESGLLIEENGRRHVAEWAELNGDHILKHSLSHDQHRAGGIARAENAIRNNGRFASSTSTPPAGAPAWSPASPPADGQHPPANPNNPTDRITQPDQTDQPAGAHNAPLEPNEREPPQTSSPELRQLFETQNHGLSDEEKRHYARAMNVEREWKETKADSLPIPGFEDVGNLVKGMPTEDNP